MNALISILWSFARGDTDSQSFERWIYANSDSLKTAIDEGLLIDMLAVDYSNSEETGEMRLRLRNALERLDPQNCFCPALKDRDSVPLNNQSTLEYFGSFEELAMLTPWISLSRCGRCNQFWLVGTDTTNDEVLVARISARQATEIKENDNWPDLFNNSIALWPTPEWLTGHGFSSLDEWRKNNPPPTNKDKSTID